MPSNRLSNWEAAFRAQMKKRREALGMTQTDMAGYLKNRGLPFHQQTVQKVESGERPIRLDEAFFIAEYLDTSVDAMVTPIGDELGDAIIFIDSLRRRSAVARDNALEDWEEWSNELDILAVTFIDAYNRAAQSEQPEWTLELLWLASWLVKGLWADSAFQDLVTYLNGLASTGGDWREDAPTFPRAAPGYQWLLDDIDAFEGIDEKERPGYLGDLDPQTLYTYLVAKRPQLAENDEAPSEAIPNEADGSEVFALMDPEQLDRENWTFNHQMPDETLKWFLDRVMSDG